MLLTLLISQWFLVVDFGQKNADWASGNTAMLKIPYRYFHLLIKFNGLYNFQNNIFLSIFITWCSRNKSILSSYIICWVNIGTELFLRNDKNPFVRTEHLYTKNHIVISKDSFTFTFIVFFFKWIMNFFWTSITSVKFPLKKRHIFNCL